MISDRKLVFEDRYLEFGSGLQNSSCELVCKLNTGGALKQETEVGGAAAVLWGSDQQFIRAVAQQQRPKL